MTKLQDFLNTPIKDLVKGGRAMKAGDLFGLELECEGKNVDFGNDDPELIRDWRPERDGSLRNNHGSSCEWIFNGPAVYKKAVERVETLFSYFTKRKAKLVTSNRTSTHVHYNMGDKNAYQLVNMFILFSICEDILDRYCGEDRRGNLFCLSSRHAEAQLRWVEDACFGYGNFAQIREDHRYCSLNLAAINKFGTVEFRGMRGLDNKEDIIEWLTILNSFCEYGCYTMKSPVEIVEKISKNGPRGFIEEVFGKPNAQKLTAGLSDDYLNVSVFEGLRLVQMLCYRIGTEFDQVRLRGKDFWASFADNAEPQLDIDPGMLDVADVRPRRGALRQNPFENRGEAIPMARGARDLAAAAREMELRAREGNRLRAQEAEALALNRPIRLRPGLEPVMPIWANAPAPRDDF